MPTRSASCAASTRRPLSCRSRLEPVEHAVEGGDDAADLVVAAHLQALAGPQQVDHLHPLRQARERRERAPQQHRVHRDRDHEPDGTTISASVERDRGADRHRRDDQQDRDRRQQRRR